MCVKIYIIKSSRPCARLVNGENIHKINRFSVLHYPVSRLLHGRILLHSLIIYIYIYYNTLLLLSRLVYYDESLITFQILTRNCYFYSYIFNYFSYSLGFNIRIYVHTISMIFYYYLHQRVVVTFDDDLYITANLFGLFLGEVISFFFFSSDD